MEVGSPRASSIGAAGGAASMWRWNSPALYLFGGLAVVMGLITVALIVLLCSRRKPSAAAVPSYAPPSGGRPAPVPLDAEPKVVVIMAGDALPRFLAKAVPSSLRPPPPTPV